MKIQFKKITLVAIFFSVVTAVTFVSYGAEKFIYDSRGKRDPMVPLIGQEKITGAVKLADVASIDDIKLEGIAGITTGSKSAIINGELVKEKYRAGEIEIKKITKNSVLLTIGGKEYNIKLIEEEAKKE